MVEPVDFGFRWINDITIELRDERPDSEFQLKISADTGEKKYAIRKSDERTIRRVSNERISSNETKLIVVELFEYRREYKMFKKKARIFSKTILLQDDEIYTKKTCLDDNTGISATVEFSYTTGGNLRSQVEGARMVTDQQEVVLDKIKRVHAFFENLEGICSVIKEIHPYIEGCCSALLLLYKLCERQKECRDAARSLVDEMDDLLRYGVERVGDMLKEDSYTRVAFESIACSIKEISEFIREQSKRVAGGLRDALSLSRKSEIEGLQEKFKRAKEGLRDSINLGTWERVVDADLRSKLDSVLKAHYSSGEGCLEDTRKGLLAEVDTWVRGSSEEQTVWVHGYAGSGKSALLNSIAENLESAGIPFTCFPCRRDDTELSNIHRMLPTISYSFTEYYGDYRGVVSDVLRRPAGHSIITGDVKKQSELLFGKTYDLVLSKGSSRPSVHVILIDALDECRSHRDGRKTPDEHRAFLHSLIGLASTIPWIKVLITSRPERNIVDVFKGTPHAIRRIDINSDKWKTSSDIRLFIEAQSEKLKLNLSLDQVERFQEKASGLFLWCTTLFRYIEESKESTSRTVVDILEGQLPNSRDNPHAPLYLLYQRVLDSAVSRARDKELMEAILGIIFVAAMRRPLSANAIADILHPDEKGAELKEKREWVSNIIRSLFAIVYIEEETNTVRTCHPSVLDFTGGMLAVGFPAISSTIKPFSIKHTEIHARVFNGCFSIMDRDLRFNICELEDSFSFNKDVPGLPARITGNISEALQYGLLFWVTHLEQSGVIGGDEKVFAFLNSLKAVFWVEALSLLDFIDRGILMLQDCTRIFAARQRVADIASEWERFLLAYGDALKSTPHLYLSALSWLPDNSRLWNVIHASFSPALPIILNAPETWNNERWSESVGMSVESVTYSPGGQLFAAGCENGSIRFWEARSKKREREPFITESVVLATSFSPNNRWLASGHLDGKIRLWDLRADSPVPRVLEGHTSWVRSVSFSSNGEKIVSCSDDKSIKSWDVESGVAIIASFNGHSNYVTSVSFSADDTRIVSCSGDLTVRIWDSKTGEQIVEPLRGHSDWVRCVACSRDGKLIASGSEDATIILWNAQTYKQIGEPLTGHVDWVNSVCFSDDSRFIVSGSSDCSIRIWSIENRSLLRELRGHTDWIRSVTFSPDGQNILSGSSDGTTRVWDIKETAYALQQSSGDPTQALCVSYVPLSNLIVSGSSDRNIHFWDSYTGASIGNPIHGHTDTINTLAVSSDGQWIVSGSSDSTLRISDISSGASLGEPMLGHTKQINSVIISLDNQFVASASDDRTVRLWNVATRDAVKTFEGHENRVNSVAFSIDGKFVISGSSDNTIRLWDTRIGETDIREPLKGHSSHVTFVAVSPDGRCLASSSIDNTIRIWSMSTFSVIHVLQGHFDWVTPVAFSPESNFLVSGSWDRTLRVWNVQTGEAVGDPLKGHIGRIHSISFAPGGYKFASASVDGTVRVWDARVRTDLQLYKRVEVNYAQLGEEELRIRWNASRAHMINNNGWIKDGDKLLLWVPWQYQRDVKAGTRLVIGAHAKNAMRPEVDYKKLFRYSGTCWTEVYTTDRQRWKVTVGATD